MTKQTNSPSCFLILLSLYLGMLGKQDNFTLTNFFYMTREHNINMAFLLIYIFTVYFEVTVLAKYMVSKISHTTHIPMYLET